MHLCPFGCRVMFLYFPGSDEWSSILITIILKGGKPMLGMEIHYVNCTLHPPHVTEADICIKLIMLHFELHGDRSSSEQPYFPSLEWSSLVRSGHQITMAVGVVPLPREIAVPRLWCICGCDIVKGEVRCEIKGLYWPCASVCSCWVQQEAALFSIIVCI